MTDAKPPAQFFDWATELSDAQGHVTLSEQEAHEIGARLRRQHARIAELEQEVAHTDSLLGKANALARIRAHRIAELEAQLEAIGASAGSEPVAPAGATSNTHWNQAPCVHCGCTEGQHFNARCHHIQGETRYTPTPKADSQPAVDALAEAEYFIDNPSAWSNFDQRASDAIAAVCNAFRAAHDKHQYRPRLPRRRFRAAEAAASSTAQDGGDIAMFTTPAQRGER